MQLWTVLTVCALSCLVSVYAAEKKATNTIGLLDKVLNLGRRYNNEQYPCQGEDVCNGGECFQYPGSAFKFCRDCPAGKAGYRCEKSDPCFANNNLGNRMCDSTDVNSKNKCQWELENSGQHTYECFCDGSNGYPSKTCPPV